MKNKIEVVDFEFCGFSRTPPVNSDKNLVCTCRIILDDTVHLDRIFVFDSDFIKKIDLNELEPKKNKLDLGRQVTGENIKQNLSVFLISEKDIPQILIEDECLCSYICMEILEKMTRSLEEDKE